MTKPNLQLNQQIEEMRTRLSENAQSEQALLGALSEALGQVDQQLLETVRQVTADHEARRGDILNELQVLASRLCVFPKALPSAEPVRAREQVTSLYGKVSELPARQNLEAVTVPLTAKNGKTRHAPGDWRQAASNIDDELEFYLDAQAQTN